MIWVAPDRLYFSFLLSCAACLQPVITRHVTVCLAQPWGGSQRIAVGADGCCSSTWAATNFGIQLIICYDWMRATQTHSQNVLHSLSSSLPSSSPWDSHSAQALRESPAPSCTALGLHVCTLRSDRNHAGTNQFKGFCFVFFFSFYRVCSLCMQHGVFP